MASPSVSLGSPDHPVPPRERALHAWAARQVAAAGGADTEAARALWVTALTSRHSGQQARARAHVAIYEGLWRAGVTLDPDLGSELLRNAVWFADIAMADWLLAHGAPLRPEAVGDNLVRGASTPAMVDWAVQKGLTCADGEVAGATPLIVHLLHLKGWDALPLIHAWLPHGLDVHRCLAQPDGWFRLPQGANAFSAVVNLWANEGLDAHKPELRARVERLWHGLRDLGISPHVPDAAGQSALVRVREETFEYTDLKPWVAQVESWEQAWTMRQHPTARPSARPRWRRG